MARVNKGRTKIWVRPFATSTARNQLDSEGDDVCVDEEENVKDGNTNVCQGTLENMQDKTREAAQLFECEVELTEEYKELLVKAVAERIKQKMTDNDMWTYIEKETGYNHKIVWNELRGTVIKKINSLLPANDLVENIPPEMQLSQSDWLCFDLILVHQQINVIKTDPQVNNRDSKDEPQCLQELFELIKKYNVENLAGEALMEAWKSLTSEYNSRGRQCSPMLLQLRWYQMKKLTRSHFYDTSSHNTNLRVQKTLESAVVVDLTVLQIEIAVAYNTIITQDCPSWETLITEKRVILSEEFSATNPQLYKNKTQSSQAPKPSSEPPVLLIELDENQLENHDKKTNAEGNNVTDDTVVIDLKHDKEHVAALQNVVVERTHDKYVTLPVNSSNIEENEEFRLYFVKEVAIMMSSQQKITKYTWRKLKSQMLVERDCKEIWNAMRNLTVNKVVNLITSNDVLQNIDPTMRLTEAEWLLFDLILVHERVHSVYHNVLDAECLRDLFNLAIEYDVENLNGNELAAAWINVTIKYSRGGRQSSPMLLQLRWYQMKELARQQVYKPSMQLDRKKSKILMELATKHQKIITKNWLIWNALVKLKKVILAEDFITILKLGKWKEVEASDGWYLCIKEEISNSEANPNINDTSNDIIFIVCDESQSNTENQFDTILKETPKDLTSETINNPHERKPLEIIDLDSDDEVEEIICEKADNISNISQEKLKNIMNTSKIHLESHVVNKNSVGDISKNHVEADLVMHKSVNKHICNDEPIMCDSDDEMDTILQEKANLMSIELPENLKTLNKIIGEEVDEFKRVNSKIYAMEVEEVGIMKKEIEVMTGKTDEGLEEADFDDKNVEFVDDGIKFEEGSEYTTTKHESIPVSSSSTDDESDTDVSKDDPQIDPKLLMDTSVCTKRIDCLEVFIFIDYDSLRDKRLIEHVETETKPFGKAAMKCSPKNADIESSHDDDDVETPFQVTEKIKYTSWMLQKPKKRKYTARQLSENPDFNNQLKTLTPGFLASMANMELLKECQPLTVDLHKAFEKKLVNGKMYLKRTCFKSIKVNEIKNSKNQPPSIANVLTEGQNMKMAEHVRNLIASMISDSQDQCDSMTNVTPKIPIRRKAISLPDKDQIRLLNKSLLTAEISPTHQPLLNLPTVNTINSIDNGPARIICSLEEPNSKRLKRESENSGKLPLNRSIYCCWAREKIVRTENNSDLNCIEHKCVKNCCTCCCRIDLDILTNSKCIYPKRKLPTASKNISILSKDVHKYVQNSSRVNNNASCNSQVSGSPRLICSAVTNNTESRSVNSNASFKTIIKYGETDNTIKILDASKGNISSDKTLNYTNYINNLTIIRKDQERTETNINPAVAKSSNSHKIKVEANTMPPLTKIMRKLRATHAKKPAQPVKPPVEPPSTYVVLPPGVNLVQLPDQIALAFNPGVQVSPEEMESLVALCATMNNFQMQNTTPLQVPPLLFTNR